MAIGDKAINDYEDINTVDTRTASSSTIQISTGKRLVGRVDLEEYQRRQNMQISTAVDTLKIAEFFPKIRPVCDIFIPEPKRFNLILEET